MSRLLILSALAIGVGLTAVVIGLQAAVAVCVGAAVGAVAAFSLNKNPIYGAGAGLGLSLCVMIFFVYLYARPPRCDFGDPVDLPTLTHPAGYVYVIQDTEFSKRYKIGRTNNPARRLHEIRTLLPGESDIVAIVDTQDAPALEWQLHQRYADSRKRGEWFDLSDAQVHEICRI